MITTDLKAGNLGVGVMGGTTQSFTAINGPLEEFQMSSAPYSPRRTTTKTTTWKLSGKHFGALKGFLEILKQPELFAPL